MDWTTAFTIIGSFGAASTAQIVNHILTQKREDKKYKKECLQNFYSPLVHKFIDFITGEALYNSSLEAFQYDFSNKNPLFKEIMDITEKNLKYASAELINVYQEVKNYIDFNDAIIVINDPEDYRFWNLFIEMANIFFSEYIEINKMFKTNSNSIDEKLKAPYFFTHFYLLINDCVGIEEIPSSEIFGIYDLIEFVLYPINNHTSRIIRIRKELDIHWYHGIRSHRSQECYSDACQFIYELADEFEIASEKRAWQFKDLLDEGIM